MTRDKVNAAPSRPSLRHVLLLASTILTACLWQPALAQSQTLEPGRADRRVDTRADVGSIPFKISVDGQSVDQSGDIGMAEIAHQSDSGLSAVEIQVKFDGLETRPTLNVLARPSGGQISFETASNYPGFIARSEIRVLGQANWLGQQAVIILPVDINGTASWTPPQGEVPLSYVLRVYDTQGRFDETIPAAVTPVDDGSGHGSTDLSTDRAASRNIPIYGGAVTVYGSSVPGGYAVRALGETIALDANRAFVVQRILPPGEHQVDVALAGNQGKDGLQFSRDINIPDNDWFYVALADVTLGLRNGDEQIESVRPGEYDDIYSKGRLAFYVKGKIKGEYLLTAAADTGEEGLQELFGNIGERNPRDFLRHLDPEDYYPVYGDDSTMVEDAPTSGKFYVRLERGDSHVMWGNYQTSITGTEFLRSERALYGANALYRSEETTSFGERRTEVTAYAALPDTLPQREEFLATGGSAYFLRRQDITVGSESLAIEVRDATTGRVISRRSLQYGVDYSVDYLQGVVILAAPLSWRTIAGGPVRDGAFGSGNIYLIAQYEFVPNANDVDGYAYGGRAQHWITDNLRVGVTGVSETTGPADQIGLGADVELRASDITFLRAEIARSEGAGFGLAQSSDGGLTWGDQSAAGLANKPALAWRVEGQLGLEDLGQGGIEGLAGFYYEHKQAGFSSLSQQISTDQWLWGLSADVALEEDVNVALSYDNFEDGEGQIKREGEAGLGWRFDDHWNAVLGVTYTELVSPRAIAAGKSGYNGSRLDAGVRIEHQWAEDGLVYGFGQATLSTRGDISRNDRAGVGAELGLTDKIAVSGEVSYGSGGLGALAGVTYDPSPDEHYYAGYRLEALQAFDVSQSFALLDDQKGRFVVGLKRRLDEYASAYAETSFDSFGQKRSLSQTYGILFTPDSFWNVDAGLVLGQVRDEVINPATGLQRSDFDRYAPSLAVSYLDEKAGIQANLRGEARIEDSTDHTRDQNTYLFAGGLSWKTGKDWRLLANVDAVISDARSPDTAFQDTDYVEASIGYAYRPVENDRLNALFRYTWLYDMPGNNQLVSGSAGDLFAPAQRSHILSLDVDYDLFPWLTLGAKYGFRYGEVKNRTSDGSGSGFEDDWQVSSAHLGILRADLHVIKNWDVLLEGRVMHMPEAQTTDLGALAAVYRHLGDNFKVGLGYNFGRFSDDMRDLTFNDQGVLVNVVAKF